MSEYVRVSSGNYSIGIGMEEVASIHARERSAGRSVGSDEEAKNHIPVSLIAGMPERSIFTAEFEIKHSLVTISGALRMSEKSPNLERLVHERAAASRRNVGQSEYLSSAVRQLFTEGADEEVPLVGLSWEEAHSLAEADGRQLPSCLQWEIAERYVVGGISSMGLDEWCADLFDAEWPQRASTAEDVCNEQRGSFGCPAGRHEIRGGRLHPAERFHGVSNDKGLVSTGFRLIAPIQWSAVEGYKL